MAAKDSKNIVIDLQKISISINNDIDSILQFRAWDKLQEILREFASNLNEYNPAGKHYEEFNPKRFHNVVFISGRRGTGKTTFLRSILAHAATNGIPSYFPVALVDPTLIETHESIFMQVVTKIRDRVYEMYQSTPEKDIRPDFQKCIEKMGEGLKLLNSSNEGATTDTSWFLAKAFMNTTGGQNLEKSFHELIECATQILKKDLLIVAFDDVDTETSKARGVMELIRKYLTSPKLVVLITGDPALYSHIVKRNRAKELLINLKKANSSEADLVEHLEQQYLGKVFPVQFRLHLESLDDIQRSIKNGADQTSLVLRNKGVERKLDDYLIDLFKSALAIAENEARKFSSFLLREPLRTVLQIIKRSWKVDKEGPDLKESLFVSLRDSYVGALIKEEIKLDSLYLGDVHPHTIAIAQFELNERHNKLETGFYFRPDGNVDSYNDIQIILASLVALETGSGNFFKRARKSLHLMLAGPGSCTIYSKYVQGNGRLAPGFPDYLGLKKTESISHLAAHFSPYLQPEKNQIGSGVIRTVRSIKAVKDSHQKRINDFYQPKDPWATSLSDLLKELKDIELSDLDKNSLHTAVAAVLASSHSISEPGSFVFNCVSIYSLLATLAELLEAEDQNSMERILRRRIANHTYPYPGSDTLSGQNDPGGGRDEDDENDDGDLNFQQLGIDLLAWQKSNETSKFEGSSLLIGKIWTRFFYSLTKISEQTAGEKLLAEIMETFVCAVINAFLVEECNFGIGKDNLEFRNALIDASNPSVRPKDLAKNLKKVQKALGSEVSLREYLPLTSLIVSCPLMTIFLRSKEPWSAAVRKIFLEIDPTLFAKEHSEYGLAYISRLPISGTFK